MRPLALALTGGVACGKSTVRLELSRRCDCAVFNADDFVHELLARPDIVSQIQQAFPHAIKQGCVDRAALRQEVFQHHASRKTLEAILHPAVSQEWRSQLADNRHAGRSFLAEIPLLYEINASDAFDHVIVVASSPSIQRDRLQNNRGLSGELATQILASQMPLDDKIAQADFVIWNDGPLEVLQQQIDQLVHELKRA